MDWDGDGNHDWQDDVFYNSVISPSKDDNSNTQNFASDCSNASKSSIITKIIMVLLVIKILEWIFC